MICTRYNSASCEKIVQEGLFDAAFKNGRLAAAHKGIVDYASAAGYCKMMLGTHGGCEQSLATSYQTSVNKRNNMCGKLSLRTGDLLVNPQNRAEVLSVVDPSYDSLDKQQKSMTGTFTFFVILIMFLFYASLVEEVREIILMADFLLHFPAVYSPDDPGGKDLGADHEDRRYVIERISLRHRAILALVVLCRIMIIGIIFSFGTWFLLTEDSYMELVLNAVALSFITGIDEVIFDTFVEHTMKKDHIGVDDVQPLHFSGMMPGSHSTTWSAWFYMQHVWGLVLLPLLATSVVLWHQFFVRTPLITAMRCACLQDGTHCAESMVNQAAWWSHYWSRTLPAAMHQIEAMRLQGA